MSYSSDVTSSSYAISSGDYSSYPKTRAFNDTTSTSDYWMASTMTLASSWIGQDFGSGNLVSIREFVISQISYYYVIESGTEWGSYAKTVSLQYSDDASTWTAAETFTLSYYSGSDRGAKLYSTTCVTSADYGCHRYWRIKALTGYSSYYWMVSEIQMYTLTTGYATITVTNSSGAVISGATVTLGSTSGTTGSAGTVTFSGLTTGTKALSVSYVGYKTTTSSITVSAGKLITSTVAMSSDTVLDVQEV